jgi:raffinose/stachyose/melibiose transport system permease protein
METAGAKFFKLLIYCFLTIFIIFIGYPIIYAIGSSFKSIGEFLIGGTSIIPKEWHFENYLIAWKQANFSRYTFNSLIFAILSVLGTVVTTSMTGYTLSRSTFPGKKLVMSSFGFMLFLLGAVTIYPIFIMCKKMGLLDSLWGMVIAQIASAQAFYSLIVMGYCDGISKEIDESARVDGASFFQIYRLIILPIVKPIIATVVILQFREAWNNFMMPLAFTIARPELRPLTVGVVMLKDQGDGVAAWNLMLAGTVMSLLPILVVYIFANKYFITGITQGSLKG